MNAPHMSTYIIVKIKVTIHSFQDRVENYLQATHDYSNQISVRLQPGETANHKPGRFEMWYGHFRYNILINFKKTRKNHKKHTVSSSK